MRTTKSQKIAEFFAKLRNFVVGLAEKLRQDLATVLDNGRNPLSEEEMHFMRCQIMKISEKEKIESISVTAVWEGSGKIAGTIAAIKKLMGTFGSEAEACRRDSQRHFRPCKIRIIWMHSCEAFVTWFIAPRDCRTHCRGGCHGDKNSQVHSDQEHGDYRITVERIAMTANWDDDLKSMWQLKVRDACGELLTEADKALKRAREQETAENNGGWKG
jgi:hypothetical protein